MADAASADRGRKPPFYKNVLVRHPVVPLFRISTPSRDELARLDPVVVMGRGHSGTRVVAWMIHRLGIDLGIDETETPSGDPLDRSLRHHLRIVAERSMRLGPTRHPDRLTANRFQRAVRGHLRRRGRPVSAGHWGWKFPESYLTGPSIIEAFPNARFVHLIRDGRDLAFKRHLTDLAEHRLARRILRQVDLVDAPHHLQAAASWAIQVERFLDFASTLRDDRLLTVRYEDLVDDPSTQLKRIADFIGVPVTAEADEYARHQVKSTDKSSHTAQDPKLVGEVLPILEPVLVRTGYLSKP